MKMEKERL